MPAQAEGHGSGRGWISPAAWLLLGLVLSGAGGCGYALEGTRRSGPLKDARTISIAGFVNRTHEPGLERTIEDAVRSRFLRDGRLQVVESADADVSLEAIIEEYTLTPIGFSRQDQVQRYRVLIRTSVIVRDSVREKAVLNQELESESDFDVASGSITSSDVNRRGASGAISSLFADELISLVLEGF